MKIENKTYTGITQQKLIDMYAYAQKNLLPYENIFTTNSDNAYQILANFRREARRHNYPTELIEDITNRAQQGDYLQLVDFINSFCA